MHHLAEHRQGAVVQAVGKEVSFGIRPSDIYDKSLAGPVAAVPENTITVEVEVIEPMGAESVLYVTSGDADMVINLDSATAAKEREPLDVVVDMSKCHVFDKETEVTVI